MNPPSPIPTPQEETWQMAELLAVGSETRVVRGRPAVVPGPAGGLAVAFDGQKDAIVVARNPLAGSIEFTVEMIFQVAPGGAEEQRVLHVQEYGSDDRLLLETRRGDAAGATWYADTIVCSGGKTCILADAAHAHAAGVWQTLALVCDGVMMHHYVDQVEEVKAPCRTRPWGDGAVYLGMRANAVTPFRGQIASMRFSQWARTAASLWSISRATSAPEGVKTGGHSA